MNCNCTLHSGGAMTTTVVQEALTLERRADGRLWAARGGAARPVCVLRCFPWSEPVRFVSLRDDDENEVALVADPAKLDDQSRSALEAELARAGVVFEVTGGLAIEGGGEIRHWRGGGRRGGGG